MVFTPCALDFRETSMVAAHILIVEDEVKLARFI